MFNLKKTKYQFDLFSINSSYQQHSTKSSLHPELKRYDPHWYLIKYFI